MALRKNAKVDLIKRVPLFAQCSRRELEEIAQIADELDFPEGKELTREGAPGREFFVLLEGTADVVQGSRKLRTVSGGDFFGEIALISKVPRTATVKTSSPVRALVVTDRAFRQLLERAPGIQLKVLQALAERVAPTTAP
ncbi:MAG: cyclic nucleotide-binding domain-containing protein [Actinomycetota bacterium]|nr:cyclic nucleotide-binding domain-containing protein [Actinomycetota bacterium]